MYALRNLVDGVEFNDNGCDKLKDCIPCIEGKQAVHSLPKGQSKRAKEL